MNTMTAKALTTELFNARRMADKFDGYNLDDVMAWTAQVMVELMDGDLTADEVWAEVEALDNPL